MKPTIRYIEGNRIGTRIKLETNMGSVTLEGEANFVLAMFYAVTNEKTLRENIDEESSTTMTLDEIERRYILSVLQQCRGNQVHAARALGINRSKLYRRLKEYGVSRVI